jgi:hypothetical protein
VERINMPKSVETRPTQHDKEIAAIRKLLMQGAKMLVRLESNLTRLEAAQARAQRERTVSKRRCRRS